MNYQEIKYEFENDVATITLCNPKTYNAISQNMASEILDALKIANSQARAVIIGSDGENFCSGANLLDGGFELENDNRDIGKILDEFYNPVIRQMRNMDIPIINALKGAVVGIGCAVALAGDIIIAREDVYFLLSFKNIALVPDGGSAYLLARTIGRVKTMEMMLLAPKVYAKEALDRGMLTRITSTTDFDKLVSDIAQTLAKGPTTSLGYIRKIAWGALDNSFEEHLADERIYQRDAARTQDFVEGVNAFRQKRAPNFSGK